MNIDIIVTTYNRSERASLTVQQFLDLECRFFKRIILVDSSDGLSISDYPISQDFVYVRSSHKNQPFQRYLGYLKSTADVLLYLDDDMDLLSVESLVKELGRFEDGHLVGVNFQFQNDNAFLAAVPRNVTAGWSGTFGRRIKWFTGSPVIKENAFWLCGLRGKRRGGQAIDFVQGGSFAARRAALYQNLHFGLFDLFEVKMGMGEDVILGYTLSKQGVIWAAKGDVFYHNDQQDSSYSPDLASFNERVSFSRLYLSLEFQRLNDKCSLVAGLHYHWYMMWLSLALLLSVSVRPSGSRLAVLKGWIKGWAQAIFWRRRPLDECQKEWFEEAQKDLGMSKGVS